MSGKDERVKYYSRKKKEVLVLDVVYHEEGHKAFQNEAESLRRKVAEMERRECAYLAKISGFSVAVGQLADAAKHLANVANVK